MTNRALELLVAHGLDAVNIDIKGDAEVVKRFCGADVNMVWRNAIRARECGVWVELTTLVIPGVNDTEEGLSRIAQRIKRELGGDTPWHVTGYYPAYEFRSESFVPATPVTTLDKARDIGKAEGLKYVYAGNVPGHPYENTYCPGCNQSLIERYGFSITKYDISPDKRCPYCGEEIPIIGEPNVPNHRQITQY